MTVIELLKNLGVYIIGIGFVLLFGGIVVGVFGMLFSKFLEWFAELIKLNW